MPRRANTTPLLLLHHSFAFSRAHSMERCIRRVHNNNNQNLHSPFFLIFN